MRVLGIEAGADAGVVHPIFSGVVRTTVDAFVASVVFPCCRLELLVALAEIESLCLVVSSQEEVEE